MYFATKNIENIEGLWIIFIVLIFNQLSRVSLKMINFRIFKNHYVIVYVAIF